MEPEPRVASPAAPTVQARQRRGPHKRPALGGGDLAARLEAKDDLTGVVAERRAAEARGDAGADTAGELADT